MPLLIDVLGGNLLEAPHPEYVLLLLVATLLPGSLGVLAAWRGHVILVWVIAALFIALWVVWWRHFLILSAMPVLYLGTAVLTTVASQAKERR